MGTEPVVFDCSRAGPADLALVDLIARATLEARRDGRDLLLRNAAPDLLELVRICGLAGVLRVEPGRQAEEREQLRGVEEEGDLGDLSV